MKPRGDHWTLGILAALTAVLLLASCTPNGGAIYYTIENEQKVATSTLPKEITVADLVAVVPGPGAATYMVASGAIWKGLLAAAGEVVDWGGTPPVPVTPPVNPGGQALCNALVVFKGTMPNPRLFGGFFTTGATLGLSMSDDAPGLSWTSGTAGQVSDLNVKGKQVTLLQVANNNLFATVATLSGSSYVYEMYFSADGTTWMPFLTGRPSTDERLPISGVAWDLTNYWVVSGTKVYSGASAPLSTTPLSLGAYTIDAADDFPGIFANGANVFIPSKLGSVYLFNGTTWTKISAAQVSSATVGFLAVGGPVDGGDKYLAGSAGFGYYTLSVSGASLSRFSDNTIALYSAAVRRIMVDGTTVFLGTSGAGLWRSTFTASGAPNASGWIHE